MKVRTEKRTLKHQAMTLSIICAIASANFIPQASAGELTQPPRARKSAPANAPAIGAQKPDGLCHDDTKQATPDQILNAQMIALKLVAQLEQDNAWAKSQGEEISVALVARMGTDPGGNVVYRETDDARNFITLDQMMKFAKAEAKATKKSVSTALKRYEDRSKSLKYSHLGIIIHNPPTFHSGITPDWAFIHELKPCKQKTAKIYEEGVDQFFIDDPYDYGAQIIVPTPAMQRRIRELVTNPDRAKDFLADFYNVGAKWDNVKEHNSNMFPLLAVGAALSDSYQTIDRAGAIEMLRSSDYRPTRIGLRGKYSLAANDFYAPILKMFEGTKYAVIRDSENPYSDDYDIVEVVTALSVQQYMSRGNMLMMNPVEISLTADEKIYKNDKEREKAAKKIAAAAAAAAARHP